MSPKPKIETDDDEMLPEYDFTGAVRAQYYDRYREGTNVILLDQTWRKYSAMPER